MLSRSKRYRLCGELQKHFTDYYLEVDRATVVFTHKKTRQKVSFPLDDFIVETGGPEEYRLRPQSEWPMVG